MNAERELETFKSVGIQAKKISRVARHAQDSFRLDKSLSLGNDEKENHSSINLGVGTGVSFIVE